MKITIKTPDKKINFSLDDHFNEKVIKKEAKKVIRERWPEYVGKIQYMTWRY